MTNGKTAEEKLADEKMGGGPGGALPDIDWAALREELLGLGYDPGFRQSDLESQVAEIQRLRQNISRLIARGESPQFINPMRDRLNAAEEELLAMATEMWGPGATGGAGGVEAISSFIERHEQRTTARYLDIPTPEAFLDDFDVALATHVQGLVQTGELDKDTARWILDNPDILLDEYIADLGARAAAGEQIFTPVGVEGEPELLGERPGQQEIRDIQTTTAITAGVTPTGGETAVTQRTEQERLVSTLDETEEIFARPKLGYVYAVSPLDWLAERAPGTEITFGAEREKSRRIGERRGPTVITPRRVQ